MLVRNYIASQRYTFGNIVKALRKERGLSQEQLGKALGLARCVVSTWELGRSFPHFDGFCRLAAFFRVGPCSLLDFGTGILADRVDHSLAETDEGLQVIRERLGNNIKVMRTRKGMSQGGLAKAAGLTQTHICNIEKGRRNPSLVSLCAIGHVMKHCPSVLVRHTVPRKPLESALRPKPEPKPKKGLIRRIWDFLCEF